MIASIAASTFIVFAMPHKNCSRTRYVLGSYVVGIIIGGICFFFVHWMSGFGSAILHNYCDEIFAAIAVGLTAFSMVVFDLG